MSKPPRAEDRIGEDAQPDVLVGYVDGGHRHVVGRTACEPIQGADTTTVLEHINICHN